jgi:hypothetical protein
MADKNVPSAENKDAKLKVVESKKKEKKEPMSFKKLITIIIIAVLALLMVGGVYYVVVLISQDKAEKASAWGSYDGKDVRIENNNVFYNTLMNDSNLQNAYLSGDYNTMLSSYYNAYQAQVVFQALDQEAQDAGIVAPQKLVDQLILKSGVYNDADGNFSEEVFDASSDAQKTQINNFYTNYYPYSVVLADLQSTIISEKEMDFVVQLARDTRTFDYFVINYNAYPDDLAKAYAEQNPQLFSKAGISVISAASEEKIKAAYDALVAGTAWDDVVATYSEDSYKEDNGKVGSLQLFSIMSNMTDQADIDKVTSLEVGSYTNPIQGTNGFVIYRLDEAVAEADLSDAETLTVVKFYINQNKVDDITPYVDAAVARASEMAQSDFEGAAKAVNATIIPIKSSNNNIAGSQYLAGINYYDATGYLATAANDETVDRELFVSDEGHVTAAMPVQNVENTYIIAKVTGIDKENDETSYATSLLYNYYAMQQPAQDRVYSVISSDKHVDNFYNQFFATLFSSST